MRKILISIGVLISLLWSFSALGVEDNPNTILPDKEPEMKPLPPERLQDLLHISNNYAYKSVTEEDYTIEESCSTKG